MNEKVYESFPYEYIGILLNPITTDEKILKIADLCNQEKLTYLDLLDMSICKMLQELLDEKMSMDDYIVYQDCKKIADEIMKNLTMRELPRPLIFPSLCYILKWFLITYKQLKYNNPFDLRPTLEVEQFTPVTESQKLDNVSDFCIKENITAIDLMDVALATLNTDITIVDYSTIRETALVDRNVVRACADMAKIIYDFMKNNNVSAYKRSITIMLMCRACVLNSMGICADKRNDGICNCDNNGRCH